MKFTLNFWTKGDRERIYINDEDRQSLGYFERITDAEERMPDNYYDRHRLAKGDEYRYSERYNFSGDEALREAVIEALEITEVEGDAWHNFTEVSKKARNGYPCWFGNTPKKEADRLRRERDSAVYEMHQEGEG